MIRQSGNWFTDLSGQIAMTGRTMGDFPLLWAWIIRTLENPDSRARVTDAAWKLVVVLGAGLAVEQAAWRVLQRPVARLAQLAPEGSGEPDEDPDASDPDRAAEAGTTSAFDLPVADEAIDVAPSATQPAHHAGPAPTVADQLSQLMPAETTPSLSSHQLAPAPVSSTAPSPVVPGRLAPEPSAADRDSIGPALPPPILPAATPPAQRRRHRTLRSLRRLPFVALRLVLELLPLAAFVLVANLLLGTELVQSANTRAAILAYMQAYLFTRVTLCVVRTLVSPDHRSLRLIHVTDGAAAYLTRWLRRLLVVASFGWATVETGMLFGLYTGAHEALLKLVALIVHLALVVMVLQLRRPVAARLHARRGAHGFGARALNRLAGVWHWIAIFYIMALWVVWASQIQHGFNRLLHFFVVTSAVSIAGRLVAILLLGGLDRAVRVSPEMQARYPGLQERAARYYPALRAVLTFVLFVLTALALLQVWGIGSLTFFWRDPLGNRITSAAITVGIATVLAIMVWEGTNTGIDRQLERLSRDNQAVRAARLRTLTPILRTALLVVIVLVLGMTILSEIGVNIAPLLAGAGIVGVALGFGSQKLVQDFITGIFLLLENAMQVGDTVTVAGLSGTVEMLSIRTLRLRAGDGSVHIIPFSSVTTVNNANRDYANASVSVGVAYAEDTDRVGALLGEIVAGMREEPAFAPLILGDFSLWGVDELGDFAVTIKGQVRTTAGGRWPVQREINRRVKKRFEAEGIDIPYPVRTLLQPDLRTGEGKDREASRPPDPGTR